MSEARADVRRWDDDESCSASSNWNLPDSWAWASLSDISELIFGQSPPSSTYNSDQKGLPFFQGKAEFGFLHPTVIKYCTEPTRTAEVGDILMSIRAPVGPTNVADRQCGIGRGLAAIRARDQIDPSFLRYFLNRTEALLAAQGTGTTFSAITKRVLVSHPVSVAPLNEQRRISSKIDELFSDIEAGERALKRARAALTRYRKSVLKAAVTGALTADWRAANRERLEPADKLLARILAARREAWEKAERAKLKAQGKAPKGEEWRKRYKEPDTPTPPEGFILPESWTWAGFGQIGEFGRGKSKHRPRNDPKLFGGNYPFLQTGIVRQSNGRIREYDQTYNDVGLAQSKLWPAGTICITIAANIAASGILEIDACFPDSVVGLVPESEIQGRYIEMFVRTARGELDRFAPATAQKNINLEILSDVAIPFPPAEEQIEIVSRADEALSKADHVEAALDEQERAARALKQSILKAAFEGRLVPQDPNDEPAAKLLERIRKSKSASK